MPGKLRRSRKRVLEKQWQSLEEKGTVGAQLGHSLLTRSKTCDPSFGKETEQAVATTGAQGYASPCPSPSLTKHTASYHKAFGELAKQEALLACFSCAWQREMPYRGRLYISSHHICFHSSLLLKDIKVVVPVASISALKKTNMALLVPNALSIRTAEGEKTSSHSDLEQSVPEPDSLQELPDGMTLVPGQAEQKDGGEAEALSGSSAAPVPFARPCSLQAGGPHTTLWAWTAMQLSPLNVIILIYLLLMVALLLSSGYIGLRISELEQQLASMGAWPDLNLPHQDKRT
ncbi:GRAM domain-containing protein 2A-like isoform X7 [Pogoniulus pusillus]|uniref:GRAM domain-containing protein 2A-like isoform X7 n=1 Tax=Pogoniulus pusillus TaxID=488313 RepID=UPI0030B956E2